MPTLPAGRPSRTRSRRRGPKRLEALVDRLRIDATERGVARLALDRGGAGASPRARRHVERARRELREFLAGRRTSFTVPVDVRGVPKFHARVLAAARRIPFGRVVSYTTLARRIGRPRAARAVGNALAANPVPVIVPCHRVVRADGTWGRYALGGPLKTALLRLERSTSARPGSGARRSPGSTRR